MTWHLNPFSLIFLLAVILTSGVLVYALRQRQIKGSVFFVFLTISVTIWALFQGLEYAVAEPEGKILFAKFQYLGISTIGITWYLFSLGYNRKENWFSRKYYLLLIVPALAVLAAFTNELHHLLWPKITPISAAPGSDLIYAHGPAFWMIFIYNYILLGLGTYEIIKTAIKSKEIYRWQMVGLIASAAIPWVGNLIYVSGLSPVPGLDLTPLGFILSTIVIAWSIFSLRLFDLAPVARDQLMENLVDGVIVLDSGNRVIEINPRAREFLNIETKFAVGRDIVDFLQPWPGLVERFREVQSDHVEIHVGAREISDIDVRISPLVDDRRNPVGRIITIRDISEQKKLERAREETTRSIVDDLRNPLTSVVLSLETLRRQGVTTLPKLQLDALNSAQQNAQQMLDLVDSILDIYRLEKGDMPLNRKRVSLNTIATEATRSVSKLATQKRILIQVDIPAEMPRILIDPNLMRRVFQNLLDTVINSQVDGRVVRIQAGAEHGENSLVVSVVGLGGGNEPVRENLFENFAPGQGGFARNGLRMAFCRLVVEAHGGRIWVDERYQGGIKISLTIPEYAQN